MITMINKNMTFLKSNNNLSLLLKEFDTFKYFDIIKNEKKILKFSLNKTLPFL